VPEPDDEQKDEFKPAVDVENLQEDDTETFALGNHYLDFIHYIEKGGDNDPAIDYDTIIKDMLEGTDNIDAIHQLPVDKQLELREEASEGTLEHKPEKERELAEDYLASLDRSQLVSLTYHNLNETLRATIEELEAKYKTIDSMPTGSKERILKLKKAIAAKPTTE
jgi:hypothetical protein